MRNIVNNKRSACMDTISKLKFPCISLYIYNLTTKNVKHNR